MGLSRNGTSNAGVLQVPKSGNKLNQTKKRFAVWNYLRRKADNLFHLVSSQSILSERNLPSSYRITIKNSSRDNETRQRFDSLISEDFQSPTVLSSKHKGHHRTTNLCLLEILGRGAFGQVFLVKLGNSAATNRQLNNNLRRYSSEDNNSARRSAFRPLTSAASSPSNLVGKSDCFALKVVDKKHLRKNGAISQAEMEINVLTLVKNKPFFVHMQDAFQTETKLYFLMEYAAGGELFYHLQKSGPFSEAKAKFYISEVVSAIGFLHSKNILYRDLKPENIMIDATGHLKLTDFGLCCYLDPNSTPDQLAKTLCGTPAYTAPEIILNQNYGFGVDWWAVGVLLFEMIVGIPPFFHDNVEQMYSLICESPLGIPRTVSCTTRSFIERLLVRDMSARLGCGENGTEAVKNHRFFFDVDWKLVENRTMTPPFIPTLESTDDLRYFGQEFTGVDLVESAAHVDATIGEDDVMADVSRSKVGTPFNEIVDGFRFIEVATC